MAINGELTGCSLKNFHQCLRSWIILRTFAPFLVANYCTQQMHFLHDSNVLFRWIQVHFFGQKRAVFFFSLLVFRELYTMLSPRPSSTKTRIKALLSLLIYCKSSSSETIFRKIRIRHYATPTVTKRFAPHYAWGNCIKTKYYLSRWYAKKSINGQLIVINGEPSPLSAFSPFGTRKMTAQKQNSTL